MQISSKTLQIHEKEEQEMNEKNDNASCLSEEPLISADQVFNRIFVTVRLDVEQMNATSFLSRVFLSSRWLRRLWRWWRTLQILEKPKRRMKRRTAVARQGPSPPSWMRSGSCLRPLITTVLTKVKLEHLHHLHWSQGCQTLIFAAPRSCWLT